MVGVERPALCHSGSLAKVCGFRVAVRQKAKETPRQYEARSPMNLLPCWRPTYLSLLGPKIMKNAARRKAFRPCHVP